MQTAVKTNIIHKYLAIIKNSIRIKKDFFVYVQAFEKKLNTPDLLV